MGRIERDAVRAGADSIEHGADVDDATLIEMANKGNRITKFGKAVAREEANRLTALVRLARASGFVTRKA